MKLKGKSVGGVMRWRLCPDFSVHMCNKIGNNTGERGTLFDATWEEGVNRSKGCDYINTIILKAVTDKLDVASGRAVMSEESKALDFMGYAIEIFFKVLIKLCKVWGEILFNVFEGGNMGESDISAGFGFAVGIHMWRKCINGFNAIGEMGGNYVREMCFKGMLKRDWPSISGAWLRYGNTSHAFAGCRQNATDEGEINESMSLNSPITV